MVLNSNRRDWGLRIKYKGVTMRIELYWVATEDAGTFSHSFANRLEVPKGQEEMRWLLRSPYVCTVVLVWVPRNTDPETKMWVQVVHLKEGPKKHADELGKWARTRKKTNQGWTQQQVTFVGNLGTIALGTLRKTLWSRIVLPNEQGNWGYLAIINSYLLFIEVHSYSKESYGHLLG